MATRERSRTADAISAALVSGDAEFRDLAIAKLRAALHESNGVVSIAAGNMGISVRAFRRWLEDDDIRDALKVPRMFYKAP